MAKELSPLAAAAEEEKKKLKAEKKQFQKEQKAQKKEARRRAAEIARQEEALDGDGGNGLVTFGATVLIIVLWLAVICVIIKLDIGGFGSTVLAPILRDVPVLNKILPDSTVTETNDPDSYGGYASLEEAVAYIIQLEQELEQTQTASNAKDVELESLKAEIMRLQEFETAQVDFQRIRTQFYEEVVNSEKGPGAEEYREWYETMDPVTAETLYKQVIVQMEESRQVQDYAQTYANMDPKQAARMFEEMTDNLDLVTKILGAMAVDERAAIMDEISSEVGARITKLMDPDS